MRMQLSAAARFVFLVVVASVLALSTGRDARGDDSTRGQDHDSADGVETGTSDTSTPDTATPDEHTDQQPDQKTDKVAAEDRTPKVEDRAVKHASLEAASYSDTDNVTVFSPSIALGIENPEVGASLSGRYLVDVVSAASVDIVSTASRRWEEVRHAGSVDASYKPHNFGISLGGSVSDEPDYLAYGIGATITHDFDEKNLTLLFGYAYGHDTIGRSGTSFTVFSRNVERSGFTGGFTRVINKSTTFAGSLDVIIENGDSSKPYRYIPMFSAAEAAAVPAGASIEYVTTHRLPERPLEQLPLERHRLAFTGHLAHRFDTSTVRLDERVYYDNWGLPASTTDVRWIFSLGNRFELWPHLRYHVQGEVTFWRRAYVSGPAPGWDLPEFRTGDRELGPLNTVTGGAGMKFMLGPSINPRQWTLTVSGDAMHTTFPDDLYLTGRTGGIGVVTLETEQ
jgi:hypothetical protein